MDKLYEALLGLGGAAPDEWQFVTQLLLLILAAFVPCAVAVVIVCTLAGISTYVERKVAADIQRRVGPNQCNVNAFLGVLAREAVERGRKEGASSGHRLVGTIFGILVPILDIADKILGKIAPGLLIFVADAVKLLVKEEIIPAAADKPLFKLAPAIVLCSAFAALASLPYSDRFYVADFNIGIFYILAVTSIESIGILMAGWASNNKWSLLGGMRSAAQIVSYEIPIGIAVLAAIVLCGTMSMQGMTYYQMGTGPAWLQGWVWQWNMFANPFMLVLAPIYFLAGLAECNRTPFDIPEAESELVAGYHTEYTGMRFAFFFMAEYAMMCVVSAIAVTLFLGGWSTGIGVLETKVFMVEPGNPAAGFHWWASLIHLVVFGLKTYALVFVMIWIRWTIPRYRVDQMMTLCWKKLIPLTLICFTGVAAWKLIRQYIVEQMVASGRTHEEVEALLTDITGGASIVVFFAVCIWLYWWFKKPLTPEDQERRKLIARASLEGGVA